MNKIYESEQAFRERPESEKSYNGFPDQKTFDQNASEADLNTGCWDCEDCNSCHNCTRCYNCYCCNDVKNINEEDGTNGLEIREKNKVYQSYEAFVNRPESERDFNGFLSEENIYQLDLSCNGCWECYCCVGCNDCVECRSCWYCNECTGVMYGMEKNNQKKQLKK